MLTVITPITTLLASFFSPDPLFAMGSNVFGLRFIEDSTSLAASPFFDFGVQCHENCAGTLSPAAGVTATVGAGCLITTPPPAGQPAAATGHYFSNSCRSGVCIPGATLNGTMTCYLTPTDAVGQGGLFLTFGNTGNFVTNGEVCRNITLFDLNRTVAGGIDSGWKTFFIIFISIATLGVIAAAVILTKMATTGKIQTAGMHKYNYGASQYGYTGYPRGGPYDLNASRNVIY